MVEDIENELNFEHEKASDACIMSNFAYIAFQICI